MRVVVPLIALLLTTAASAEQSAPVQLAPGSLPKLVLAPSNSNAVCSERIQQVRRELGQPALDLNAAPADPLFIAAVEKRIDGCSVMVMRNNTADMRPLPEPQEPRVTPAR